MDKEFVKDDNETLDNTETLDKTENHKGDIRTSKKKEDKLVLIVLILAIIVTAIGLFFLFVGVPMWIQNQIDTKMETMKPQMIALADQIDVELKGLKESGDALAQQFSGVTFPSKNSESIENSGRIGKIQVDQIKAILNASLKSTPHRIYVYLGLENKQMILVPETELPPDYDATTRPWYQMGRDKAGTTLQPPYLDPSNGAWIISCSTPLLRQGSPGDLVGVLGQDIQLNSVIEPVMGNSLLIKTVTESGELAKKIDVTLVTPEGMIIYNLNKERIGTMLPVPEILNAMKEKKSTVISYTFVGFDSTAVIEKLDESDIYLIATFERAVVPTLFQ